MVKALVDLQDNTNRVLNMVKAKYRLRDKSQAIEYIVKEYIEFENEPELRPEFVEKMKEIQQQKSILVDDFDKRYDLK